jgi:formylglycine-generating enzyme required for sulfatase activity
MGDYLVVDHGQGWFSRYLHLDAGSISVAVGQPLARGQTLAARLHAAGSWPQHLHFEVRRGTGPSQWGVGLPGAGQDPLQTPGMFAVAPGSNLPEVREFGLTRRHPGQNAFAKSPPTTDAPGAVYVVARMLDPEGGRRLGLRAMRFLPEGSAAPLEIRPENDPAIASLLPPSGTEKGFARYSGAHAANPNPANYFRYWWRWATAGYAEDRRGPRFLLISGEDHAPSASESRFTFGPQVEGGALTAVGPEQYQFTNVAYLGTNTPVALGNPAPFVQPDQYTLEILRSNDQPLPGVTWSGPLTNGLSRVFSKHLEKEVYTFTLPAGTGPTGWKLRVSSRLVPDIAHEVCLCSGANMSYISAGAFVMGDTLNDRPGSQEQPVHTVPVSAFCMDQYEVTKALWDHVAAWAVAHGYRFDWPDSGSGRAPDHPVQTVTWFDAVKWCNARSEMEGRVPAYYTDVDQTVVYRSGQVHIPGGGVKWKAGYRLPTEAEWEKAARGGAEGQRFPWGNTISWAEANYTAGPLNNGTFAYDVSGGLGYHPEFGGGPTRTSPVGHFRPNGYGLYDMSGNVWEICWDWLGRYPDASGADPQGPPFGTHRAIRGGGWAAFAKHCRVAFRGIEWLPYRVGPDVGFRTVLPAGQ